MKMARFLRFNGVSFAYDGMVGNLLEDVEAYFPEGGWTGIVGANGCGKTTLLRLASGELEPMDGTISRPASALYVVQRTDDPPEGMAEFFASSDSGKSFWSRPNASCAFSMFFSAV